MNEVEVEEVVLLGLGESLLVVKMDGRRVLVRVSPWLRWPAVAFGVGVGVGVAACKAPLVGGSIAIGVLGYIVGYALAGRLGE